MYDIEQNIKENLAYFDDQEPDSGHRERFASKLNTGSSTRTKRFSLETSSKIAAVLVILITVSYLLIKQVDLDNHDNLYITQIEYTDEMIKIQNYYDELSASSLDQIDGLAQNEDEAARLKSVAKKKMEKLDANLAMIEKEYMKNPQNKELKEAVINNKKMKAQVANNIVEQLDNAQRGYHAGGSYPNF